MNKLFLHALALVSIASSAQNYEVIRNESYPLKAVITLSATEESPDIRILNLKEAPKPGSEFSYRKQLVNQARLAHASASHFKAEGAEAAALPTQLKGFIANNPQSVPNDNHIAISNNNKVVSVINTNIRVYNDTGTQLLGRTLGQFSAPLGNYGQISDPRVIYDPISDRFIVLYFSGSMSTTNKVILAFSKTNDPVGQWNFYELPGNKLNNGTWSDYPICTINRDELFLTFNLLKDTQGWKTGFTESIIWQIDKERGYKGDSLKTNFWNNIKYNGKACWSICPIQGGIGPSGPNAYFLSVRPSDFQNDSVFVHEITNTIASGAATISTKVYRQNRTYGLPPSAPQGNNQWLETNDCRVLCGILENNIIHYVQTTIDTNTYTSGIYYGTIENPQTPTPVLTAKIISSDSIDYGYPSIAYAGGGPSDHAVMITCSHVSKKSYPGTSAFFVNRDGLISAPLRCKEGLAWVNVLQDTNERWGDYTGIQRKYNEQGVLWLAGSYGETSGWYRTWIGKVRSTDPSLGLQPEEKTVSSAILFPIPAKEQISIEFELSKATLLTFDLYDANGRKVCTLLKDMVKAGTNQIRFETGNLSIGVYYLHITGPAEGTISKKVLVVK